MGALSGASRQPSALSGREAHTQTTVRSATKGQRNVPAFG